MRQSQFLFLAITTALATYFMNESILAGDFVFAALYACILGRNLHFSYKVTKVIRFMTNHSKK